MIQKSLQWKLILAFMAVAISTAALVAVFIRLTSADRLMRLLMDQERSGLDAELVDYYNVHGSWNGVTENWQGLITQTNATVRAPGATPVSASGDRASGAAPRSDFANQRDRRRLFGLADASGRVIVAVDPNYPAGSTLPPDQYSAGTPVMVKGKEVGVILTANFIPRFNPAENLFLQRTNDALIYAALAALIIALLIAVLLARTLLRPIRALTSAAENITRGHLDQQVTVRSKDEIGQLAESFNQMSQEVARVNRLRRQMTADIAHDLRTPLTVIAGYIESMRDGVLAPTPERMSLIYTEIERLQNLVGDLKMLSQVDAGELPLQPQPVSPLELLEHAVLPFNYKATQQGVNLEVEAEEDLPALRVDEARMMQVFGNLISNALRYTPEGGRICLSAQQNDSSVLLSVVDNGEGIAEEELPYIFDRFRRADKSRHTEGGESGLGLAIVKALVEAHGGRVQAFSKLGEGTTIQISLPSTPEIAAQKSRIMA